jgi:DNA-binding FrmR family transcriptional regulator
MMDGYAPEVKKDVVRRLRRIEGQVRGIQRMVQEDRECREIMQQMNAIDAAMRNARRLLVRAYARECLVGAQGKDERAVERLVDDLLGVMSRAG